MGGNAVASYEYSSKDVVAYGKSGKLRTVTSDLRIIPQYEIPSRPNVIKNTNFPICDVSYYGAKSEMAFATNSNI